MNRKDLTMKEEKTTVKITDFEKKTGTFRKPKLKVAIIILLAVVVLIFVLFKSGLFNKFKAGNVIDNNVLTTYTVSRRNISQSLTSSGTLQPNDSYTITPLVTGEILEDYFEEGDIVEEDQLLYKIDSANIETSIKRARNSLKDTQKSLDKALKDRDNLNVKSDYSGVIENIYVEIGDEVKVGEKIADIVDKDTMCIDVPFMAIDAATFSKGQNAVLTFSSYETLTGTIDKIENTTSVNELGVLTRIVKIKVKNAGGITPATTAYASVGGYSCTAPSSFYYNDEGAVLSEIAGEVTQLPFEEGEYISENAVVAVLVSEDLDDRIEQLERSVEDAESSLEDTLDNYDNYNITSPISGTVISKEYKSGDTLGGSGNSGGASMAVIYDMSAFKFTMNIDELDIDKIKDGQEVIVTSDARSGQRYIGEVTNISIQGSTSNGTTVYPVTVTIENTEDESKRTTDSDGTIHKHYKTGKTSVVSQYALESVADNTYIYADNIQIVKNADADGNVSLSIDNKELKLKSDGTYAYGSDVYVISEDMKNISVETFDETTMLRPGMNIDAEILVQNVQNVIAVPVSAIMRGYTVKVVSRAEDVETEQHGKNNDAIPEEDSAKADGKPQFDKNGTSKFDMKPGAEFGDENRTENSRNKSEGFNNSGRGSVPSDTAYEEVVVEVGVTDNNYIEIKSGLNEGDVIILDEVNSMLSSDSSTETMRGFGGMGMGGAMGGYGGGPMMGGGGGMMRPGSR